MFCPADANTGLIQLVGPIAASDLANIRVDRAPLSIRFEPRSTPPSLSGNRIEESVKNICTYNAEKFSLADVQIVSSIHTGYNLPGNTDTPVAELILSFSANSKASSNLQLSGILMCLPIYESSSTSYDAYLNQIFENDPTKPNNETLESLFYSSNTEISQTSLGYRTCFETQDDAGNIGSNSLYVLVFPHGIRLASASYRMPKQSLFTYQLPSGIRGNDATVRAYTIDDNGNKVVTQVDRSGVMYTIPLSTCSEDFKNRFEYFTIRPELVFSNKISSKFGSKTAVGTCPTVRQYKCMPFDQLRDVQGEYVQMSDGKCLDDIIQQGQTSTSSTTKESSASMSVSEIEEIIGGVLAGTLGLILIVWGLSKLSNSNE